MISPKTECNKWGPLSVVTRSSNILKANATLITKIILVAFIYSFQMLKKYTLSY